MGKNFSDVELKLLQEKIAEKNKLAVKHMFDQTKTLGVTVIESPMPTEKIRINIKPMSVNEAWRGRRFKTPKYIAYALEVSSKLPKLTMPAPPYKIYLKYGFSSKASDWDNPTKNLVDILSKKYKFNDKLIRKGIVETEIVPKGREYFEFQISAL